MFILYHKKTIFVKFLFAKYENILQVEYIRIDKFVLCISINRIKYKILILNTYLHKFYIF